MTQKSQPGSSLQDSSPRQPLSLSGFVYWTVSNANLRRRVGAGVVGGGEMWSGLFFDAFFGGKEGREETTHIIPRATCKNGEWLGMWLSWGRLRFI